MSNILGRQQVYTLIDGERDYQDNLWGEAHDAGESVAGFIVYMESYLNDAVYALTHNTGDARALNIVRKVTALGVACMERFGAPARGDML